MRAWKFTGVGKPKDVLKLKSDVPYPPPPKAGELTIKISYVSTNPGDAKLMETWIPFRCPGTPGMDFVGEIVQIGQSGSDSRWRVGMTVAGSVPIMMILRGVGVLAEFVVLPEYAVVQKPRGLDESAAAGLLGVAGQTCAVVLNNAGLCEGNSVLVNGASGGVGSLLVQILCGMGVSVTGICSAKNEALVRRLGAKEIVDYTGHKDIYSHISSICAADGGRVFDAIIDCVGNMELCYRSTGYLKRSGRFISLDGTSLLQFKSNYFPSILGGTPRTYKSVFLHPSGAFGEIVADWFERGWVKEVPIDSVFSMEDTLRAFERQATGRAVGKIVVQVQ